MPRSKVVRSAIFLGNPIVWKFERMREHFLMDLPFKAMIQANFGFFSVVYENAKI